MFKEKSDHEIPIILSKKNTKNLNKSEQKPNVLNKITFNETRILGSSQLSNNNTNISSKFSVNDYLPDAKLDHEEIADLNSKLDLVIRDSI